MKGISAARASTARAEIKAVDSYAATIAATISNALGPTGLPSPEKTSGDQTHGRTGLLVFCAEQGFTGAFSVRVLDSIEDDLSAASRFLVGTRGLSIAAARDLAPDWSAPMSSHTPAIPKLADKITNAIYRALGEGRFGGMDMIHAGWAPGRPQIVRQVLLPIALSALPPPGTTRPLTQLPTDALINSLSGGYLRAMVCKAARHAFAAENAACMEAMSAAGSQITRELGEFEATLRQLRQEAITAEIIELGTGTASARGASEALRGYRSLLLIWVSTRWRGLRHGGYYQRCGTCPLWVYRHHDIGQFGPCKQRQQGSRNGIRPGATWTRPAI